jgi:hypothetical protein
MQWSLVDVIGSVVKSNNDHISMFVVIFIATKCVVVKFDETTTTFFVLTTTLFVARNIFVVTIGALLTFYIMKNHLFYKFLFFINDQFK